ncbi:MAG: PAS domain-containing protein [Pseudomonadota bacterium]
MSAHLSSIDGESPVDRQRLSPKLAQAFEAFTETSSLLQQSYGDLQHRVTVLSEQLAEARDDRSAQLAETERLAARLASLLATLPGTVLVLDEAQRVQDHNESASELFGDALVGEHWDQLLQRVAATSVDGGGELHFVDGRRISVSVGPLRGEGGLIMLTPM